MRFVAPSATDRYYEVRVFESGRVETRPDSRHDLFNALAWLAFPRTKARINALHAAHIPRESGRRGRFRDLLTIFDEGGALVSISDPAIAQLVRGFRWQELFWERRAHLVKTTRFVVLGHAVLEQAIEPWPGITCKAIFVDASGGLDGQAAQWLSSLTPEATPRELVPLPIFGFPGWAQNDHADFYRDTRYFRPFRREPKARTVQSVPGVGQAAAVREVKRDAEESPGSEEQDAG